MQETGVYQLAKAAWCWTSCSQTKPPHLNFDVSLERRVYTTKIGNADYAGKSLAPHSPAPMTSAPGFFFFILLDEVVTILSKLNIYPMCQLSLATGWSKLNHYTININNTSCGTPFPPPDTSINLGTANVRSIKLRVNLSIF